MPKEIKSTLTKDDQKIIQLIVFQVSDEQFGIPIDVVQEIIKATTIAPIPDSPDFIKGLINVRGEIVATIDVRARFSLPAADTLSKHIVITKQEDSIFGLMVDEVLEVLRIQHADIKPPPPLLTKINDDYVKGIVIHDGRIIIILDLMKVLSEDELSKLSYVAHHDQQENDFIEPDAMSNHSPYSDRKPV